MSIKSLHFGLNPEYRWQHRPTLARLKRELFYFDKIFLNFFKFPGAYTGLSPYRDLLSASGVVSNGEMKEFQQLYEAGKLVDLNFFDSGLTEYLNDDNNPDDSSKEELHNMFDSYREFIQSGLQALDDFNILDFDKHESYFDNVLLEKNLNQGEIIEKMFLPWNKTKERSERHLELGNQLIARMNSIFLSEHSSVPCEFIPIIRILNNWTAKTHTKKTRVVNVVLLEFPEPTIKVHSDDVLSFKENNHMDLYALRTWITDLAKTTLSITEMAEKIADGLADYRRHLEAAKIKYSLTKKKLVVSTILSFLDIQKAGEKLLGSGVDLRLAELELHTAEKSIPGKHLAYIHNSFTCIEDECI